MRRPSLLLGAIAGAITSLPVIALLYAGDQLFGLPYVPFDLFDWLARILPGSVITFGIDSMVAILGRLQLGPTSEVAKQVEQLMALLLMILAGAVLGLVTALLLRRDSENPVRAGSLAGLGLFFVVAAVEISLDVAAVSAVSFLWIAALFTGWGIVLASVLAVRSGEAISEEDRAARRAMLLKLAGGSAGLALGAWGIGRLAGGDRAAALAESGAQAALTDIEPEATATIMATTRDRIAPAPGTRSEVTPDGEFYRIDINLRPPVIELENWQLEVAGFFDNARPLTLDDLMAFPAVTQAITQACISNQIGGDLIDTAFWTGARLRDVLQDLGLRPEAQELYIESADGFYESVTMMDMMDPRTLLVYGMNGETLPVRHGFPLRIYIPNRYGMKQPKWIVRMEAIGEEGAGYWVDRGWSEEARPNIISMIDTVAVEAEQGGRIPIGGIAWAGDRGIQKVEVQIDGGQWREAVLRSPPLSPLTWIQWRYDWPAESGRHTFRVRATDGTGALQVDERSTPHPSGATGYHEVTENIS